MLKSKHINSGVMNRDIEKKSRLSEIRAKAYRDTIQSRKSGAVRRLHTSIILVTVIVLASFTSVYAVLRVWKEFFE